MPTTPITIGIAAVIAFFMIVFLLTRGSQSLRNQPATFNQMSPGYGFPQRRRSGAGGWLVAVVIILAVVAYFQWSSISPYLSSLMTTVTQSQTTTCSQGSITCSPTVDAAFIDHVLKVAGSPAQGIGHTLYDLGTQNHINPAYALAFFHHESGYGLQGVARTTHSLGNIRCTHGYQCVQGYRSYATWADGAKDWFQLLHDVYLPQGKTTISTIIPIYAPASDHNNETAYIQAVQDDIARWQHGQV